MCLFERKRNRAQPTKRGVFQLVAQPSVNPRPIRFVHNHLALLRCDQSVRIDRPSTHTHTNRLCGGGGVSASSPRSLFPSAARTAASNTLKHRRGGATREKTRTQKRHVETQNWREGKEGYRSRVDLRIADLSAVYKEGRTRGSACDRRAPLLLSAAVSLCSISLPHVLSPASSHFLPALSPFLQDTTFLYASAVSASASRRRDESND